MTDARVGRRPSRMAIITAIVRKDFQAFLRDRLYVFLSILGLVAYVVIFWVLPDTVDETITVGATGGGIEGLLAQAAGAGESGFDVVAYPSRSELEEAVAAGDDDLAVGLAFPDRFFEEIAAGDSVSVAVIATADVAPELREAMESFVEEAALAISGSPPPVELQEEILGVDRAGEQVSLRERFRPLLAFLVLMIEMLSLAGLLASEMQSRTVTAVITTPARLSDFLIAKIVFGSLLAFSQVVLLLLAIRSLGTQPVLLLTLVLLGSLLVTAFALIAGSYGKDFISVMFFSLIFIIPMMIPAFALLFPGSASVWVQAIPTYGLVQGITDVTSYGAGWGETLPNLGLMAVWTAAAFAVGLGILSRKVRAL